MDIDSISIDDADLNFIYTGIGYPVVKKEDFNYMLDSDQFYELILKPALETFHLYFPVVKEATIPVSSNNIAEYGTDTYVPEGAFAVAGLQFVSQSSSATAAGSMEQGIFPQNPFFTASQIYSMGGGSGMGGFSAFGTPYGYGFEAQRYQRQFYAKSLESSSKVYWYKFDPSTFKFSCRASIGGKFYIKFACMNGDISAIPLTKKQSFLRYCRAQLQLLIANTLGLLELDLPIKLDAAKLKQDGQDETAKELAYWVSSASMPGMR